MACEKLRVQIAKSRYLWRRNDKFSVMRYFLFAILLMLSAAHAELLCPLGKPDFTASDKTAQDIASAAAALKSDAKSKGPESEVARAKRLQLAFDAIEIALKQEAINQNAKAAAYWTVVQKDLGDTRWRMQHEAKQGNPQARWLLLEVTQHELGKPWDVSACTQLRQNFSLQDQAPQTPSATLLYRKALCAAESEPKAALTLMQDAAKAGHPAAMETYGRLCADQGEKALFCAVEWLCQAADAGRSSAAGLAAYLLTSEKPGPAQAVKAAALYEMAFAAGDFASANNLGEVYERGWIGKANLAQAEFWYRKAAEAEVVPAKLNLARILWQNAKSRVEAKALIEAARLTMPAEAKQLLQQLERSRG
jgi:TPR repeat protein